MPKSLFAWLIETEYSSQQGQPRHRDRDDPEPFDHGRLYGDEKYNLQNMLLASVNAGPGKVPDGHGCFSQYIDRLYSEWKVASEGIESRDNGDAFWHGVSGVDLLVFAQRLIDACNVKRQSDGNADDSLHQRCERLSVRTRRHHF